MNFSSPSTSVHYGIGSLALMVIVIFGGGGMNLSSSYEHMTLASDFSNFINMMKGKTSSEKEKLLIMSYFSFSLNFVFSSHEQEVLMVSFCDYPMSVVCRPQFL